MTNRKLKKSVVYGVYVIGLCFLIGLILLVESLVPNKKNFKNQDYNDVSKTIFDDVIPVIKTEEKITKPFTATDINVVKKYYNKKGEEKDQQESIIYYENTYMQNDGITYGKDALFDVVSTLPGTVEDVKDDELMGKIVIIKHNDIVSSIYRCLSKTTINKGDTVIAGQVIGQSGTSNLENKAKQVVNFELLVNNKTVNPEEYYGKTLNEIKG